MTTQPTPHDRPGAGPNQRFFDIWSRFYDVPWVQRLSYRPVHDAVLPVLKSLAPERVLDIACGTGLLTSRIRRELPRSEVVGCDFSPGLLGRARRRNRRVRWIRCNALALPFPDRSFEALVSTEAFHWFPDQDAALAEFRRVLAPGGRVLVSFVNPPLEAMSQLGTRISRWLGEPAHWPTRGRMRAMVERAGLQVKSQGIVLRVPATFLLPSVLTVAARPDPE